MSEAVMQFSSEADVEALIKTLHPVVQEVVMNITVEGDLSEAGVKKLRADLIALKDDPMVFAEAIERLLQACYQWDTLPAENGQPAYKLLAKSVLSVINEAEFVEVYGEGAKLAEAAAKKFDQFADKEGPKAPKLGEAKPKGSIDLNGLKFPKRL